MSKEKKFTVAVFESDLYKDDPEKKDDYYCMILYDSKGSQDRIINLCKLNPKFSLDEIIIDLNRAIEDWFREKVENDQLFESIMCG